MSLKGNQSKLQDALVGHMNHLFETDFADGTSQSHTVTEKLHGQMETRHYIQCPVPADLPMLGDWAGLKTISLVIRHYIKDGEQCSDVRHFIRPLYPVCTFRQKHSSSDQFQQASTEAADFS